MSEQKSTACPQGTSSAKVIEVIKTETAVGTGTLPDDPYRILIQYWSLDGELLATVDTAQTNISEEWNVMI